MKITLLILAISTTILAQDKSKPTQLCSIYYANKLKDPILEMKRSDKFAHCALSCQLAIRCGGVDSFGLGVMKEIWDLFGDGNAEIKDLKADLDGIKFYAQEKALTDEECIERCEEVYP